MLILPRRGVSWSQCKCLLELAAEEDCLQIVSSGGWTQVFGSVNDTSMEIERTMGRVAVQGHRIHKACDDSATTEIGLKFKLSKDLLLELAIN